MAILKLTETKAFVDAYSIAELVSDVQTLVQEGYALGSENDDYPQGYVTRYTAGFVKESKPIEEVKTTTKRTSKAKDSE